MVAVSLIGRDLDLAELGRIVRDPARSSARLVTVVGPPGVGKTALASEVATRATSLGVVVQLEDAVDEGEIESKVARALELPLRASSSLVALLRGQGPMLLVLDAIDRLRATLFDCVPRWLDAAPELTILATGRGPLGADEEVVFALQPLAPDAAATLFRLHAARARARLRGSPDEDAQIGALVQQLDHLPLAIELAGARAATLTPKQILERARVSLDLLRRREGARVVSLEAALEVSFELLDAPAKDVLAAAALFVGPVSATAVERTLEGEGYAAAEILDALGSLVARSLVVRCAVDDDDLQRFRLLESIRTYVARHAPSRPERQRRALLHLVEEGERLTPLLEGPEEIAAATALSYLFDDLRLAAAHLAQVDDALAARAGLALAIFGVPRGLVPPAVMAQTVAAARRARVPTLLARALLELARAENRAGLVSEPRVALDEAIERARAEAEEPRAQTGANPTLLSRLLIESGRVFLERGELAAAERELARARVTLPASAAPFVEGLADNELGRIHEARGDHEAASRAFTAARGRFHAAGSVRLAAVASLNLAVVRYAEGRFEDARLLFGEALAGHRLARDPATEADNLLNTGSLHLTVGRLDEAERLSLLALAEERRLGNRRFEGLALGNLALVAHERGELELARARYEQALGVFRDVDEPRFEAVFLPFYAAARASLGDAEGARADLSRARRTLTRLEDRGSLEVLDLLESALHPEEREQRIALAERRLRESPSSRSGELPVALRIVRARHIPEPPSPLRAPAQVPKATLRVGPGARWFVVPGSDKIDLTSRGTLRRVLAVLVEQRVASPGVGLEPPALFERAWAGEKVGFEAARDRVYAAVKTLRRMGLEALLLRQDDGYLLDPRVELDRG
jgi:predicted ATPase